MFKNSYLDLPSNFYELNNPEVFKDSKLIKFNYDLAAELNFDCKNISEDDLSQYFSGQKFFPESVPFSQPYAGHQFGHFVPILGDGRAHHLGEINGHDIQLKGSGRTKFSRRGDGKSALGPVLREYLMSEAMHALAIPTTRALCAVASGESVHRQDGLEPGGIFTRVAKSHLRVGSFQYFAFRKQWDSLLTLLDYTLNRHYPELTKLSNTTEKSIEFLKIVATKQAELVANWSSIGFIHGVMNTDNCSVGGLTIDYGPCAFMDEFKAEKVFSSIDRNSRYSFFNQVPMVAWNISRLAECFVPILDKNGTSCIELIKSELEPIISNMGQLRFEKFGEKLGIKQYQVSDNKLILIFFKYLESTGLDFTISFRNLPRLFNGDLSGYPEDPLREKFLNAWKVRVKSVEGLNEINPAFIPRNHMIQKCINEAYDGDYSLFNEFNNALKTPFKENQKFMSAPGPNEKVYQTFCGT